MHSKLKHQPLNILVAAVFGVCVALVRQGTLIDGLLFAVFFLMGFLLSRNIELLLVNLGISLITIGVFASVISRILGAIPLEYMLIGFLLTFAVSTQVLKRLVRDSQSDSISQSISIFVAGTAAALIWRWPFETLTDYLGFLSPEDNAAWISTVSSFSPVHLNGFVRGSGGFVLDPLMSLLYGIRNVGSPASETDLIYATTVSTYGILEFLAMVAAGLFTKRILKPSVSPFPVRLAACLSTVSLTYIALQLARTSGHLTFIGAVTILNLILLVSTIEFKSFRFFIAISFLMSLGVIGMWWPYLIVVLLASSLMISGLPKMGVRTFFDTDFLKPKTLILTIGLGVLVTIAIIPLMTHGFGSMSPLEFLRVNGGVQPVPGYLIIFGVAALALFTKTSRKNIQLEFMTWFGIALGLFLFAIQITSYFVGPTYAPMYTYNKTLLLFAITSVPLIPTVLAQILSKFGHRQIGSIFIITIFGIGNVTTGWDLNNPRSITAPLWADQLSTMSMKYPKAKILCSTSNPQMNLEAYLCSRHSGAIQNQDVELTGSWGFLQINPTPNAQSLQLETVRRSLETLVNRKQQIVIISLEDEFKIADEDKWWMNGLPIDKLIVSTPRDRLEN